MRTFSKELEINIQYIMDCCDEYDRGRWEAVQMIMQDMDDISYWAILHRKELIDFGIEIGIYKAYTKYQIDISASTGKKYDYKRGDKYYCFESWKPLEKLINKEVE